MLDELLQRLDADLKHALQRTVTRAKKAEDDYDYPEDLPQVLLNRPKAAASRTRRAVWSVARKVGSVTSSVASSFAANLSAVRRRSPSAQRRRMASAASRRAVAESLLSVAAAVCSVSLASSKAALNLRNSVIYACCGPLQQFVLCGSMRTRFRLRVAMRLPKAWERGRLPSGL